MIFSDNMVDMCCMFHWVHNFSYNINVITKGGYPVSVINYALMCLCVSYVVPIPDSQSLWLETVNRYLYSLLDSFALAMYQTVSNITPIHHVLQCFDMFQTFIGHTVLLSKRANFCFEELQLKYFFHEIPMSYIY